MNIRKEEQLKEIVAHQDVARKNFDQEVKQRQEYEKQQGIIQGYEQTIQELMSENLQYKQTKTQGESLDQTRDQSEKKAPSPGPAPQLNPSAQGILNNPQITQLQNELEFLRHQSVEQNKTIKTLQDAIEEAKKQNQQSTEQNKKYQAQIKDFEGKLVVYDKTIKKHHQEAAAQNKRMEALKAQMQKHYEVHGKTIVEAKEKGVEYDKIIKQQNEKLYKLETQVADRDKKVENLNRKVEGHREEAADRDKKMADLERQVSEGKKEKDNLKGKAAEQDKKIEAQNRQIDKQAEEYRKEAATLKKEHNNEMEKLRAELEAHRKGAVVQKEEHKDEMANLKEQVAARDEEVADLKRQVSEGNNERENLNRKVEEHSAETNKLRETVEKQDHKIQNFEQRFSQQKDAGIKKGDEPGPSVPPNEGGHSNVEDRKPQAEKEPIAPRNVQGGDAGHPNTEPDIKEKENGKEKQQFASEPQEDIPLKINQHAGVEHVAPKNEGVRSNIEEQKEQQNPAKQKTTKTSFVEDWHPLKDPVAQVQASIVPRHLPEPSQIREHYQEQYKENKSSIIPKSFQPFEIEASEPKPKQGFFSGLFK